jgi:hypothetical protein
VRRRKCLQCNFHGTTIAGSVDISRFRDCAPALQIEWRAGAGFNALIQNAFRNAYFATQHIAKNHDINLPVKF